MAKAQEGKYKEGDQVKLKSGGPTMTVKRYNVFNANQLECQWFAGSTLNSVLKQAGLK